ILQQVLQRFFYSLRAPVTQLEVVFFRSRIVGMADQANVCDRLHCLPTEFDVFGKVFDHPPETRRQRGSIPNELIEVEKPEVLRLGPQPLSNAPGRIQGLQLRRLFLKLLFQVAQKFELSGIHRAVSWEWDAMQSGWRKPEPPPAFVVYW